MIEKEHMLQMLHEVAPSPPPFSLSLLSSNAVITISASAVFRNRDQKARFISASEIQSLFVHTQRNPLPAAQAPAGLLASGVADVALPGVYPYLKTNLEQAQ